MEVLIRNLTNETVEKLKARARQNDRSLQGELKSILEAAADRLTVADAAEVASRIRRRLEGRSFGESTESIRSDRSR